MKSYGLVVGILGVIVAGCSSSGTPTTTDNTPGGTSQAVTINIAENDWLSAKLNDQIAKILLSEQMGIPVTLTPATTTDQWTRVASGELHVSLEVWPSGHPDQMKSDLGVTVEDGGVLGPLAKVGWFVPTYMLTTHPALATWQGLQDPTVIQSLQAPGTGTKGQFLGGDPKWVQYDQEMITNLGLDLTVQYSGSEDATLAELDSAYAKRRPLLFYLWSPHWALAKYDLTMVTLPAYSDACWAKATSNGIDCDYPTDRLFKMLWPGLKDYSPKAYQFLKNMSYTTKDQIDMMGDVQLRGATVEQAARTWLGAHQDVWQKWLPQ